MFPVSIEEPEPKCPESEHVWDPRKGVPNDETDVAGVIQICIFCSVWRVIECCARDGFKKFSSLYTVEYEDATEFSVAYAASARIEREAQLKRKAQIEKKKQFENRARKVWESVSAAAAILYVVWLLSGFASKVLGSGHKSNKPRLRHTKNHDLLDFGPKISIS